ncbi:MAG: hypothetical protein IKP28_04710 [Clostridia bacterium]|nr:hypothetical protein [Clostridia bacterium]
MKKILIFTSERTGTGHKSAANALENKLRKIGYETKQVDSFETMGKFGLLLENAYIPVTTRLPKLYYTSYLIQKAFPNLIHGIVYATGKKKMLKLINEFNPDLVISVHSMFTKAISKTMRKNNIKAPFFIDVIDLINPPRVWFDENADFHFVPTEEIKQDYITKGISENKLLVSGFPIRDDIERRTVAKKIDGKINILLVNPSVKLRKNIKYAKEVSKIKNASITFICGRDERLYETLTKMQNQGEISKDIKIYSFVKNMNEFLDNAHILLAKAGPNMLLEGARSGTAIVVTGHILGQENDNYKYVTNNGFGFKCEKPSQIYNLLNDFIESKKIDECLQNVLKAECNSGTDIIVDYIHKNF